MKAAHRLSADATIVRSRCRPGRKLRPPLLALALAACALAGSFPARAQTLYWDANGIIPGAGVTPTGTWGVDAFWTPDLAGILPSVVWSPGGTAIFSAGLDAIGIYTVTVSGAQSVGGITFEEGNVTLAGLSPGTNLNFGATPGLLGVASGASATMNVLLSGSGGLSKFGPGTATLGNTNDFTGNITVSGGGVLAFSVDTSSGGSQLGIGPAAVTPNAITMSDSTLRFTGGVITLHTNRGITLGGTGGTIDVSLGGILLYDGTTQARITGGILTKTGPGDFRVYSATNTFSKLVINDGSFTCGQSTFPGLDDCYGAVPPVYLADAITMQNGGTNRTVGGVFVTNRATRGITLGPGGGVFRNDVQPYINFAPIVGVGGLRKEGNRNWTNLGTMSYSGPTVLNGGSASSFAIMQWDGYGTETGPLTLNAGRLILNHANAFSSVTMANGRIDVNTNGCIGSGTVTVTPTNNVVMANSTTLGVGPVTNVTLLNDFILNPGGLLAGGTPLIDIAANSGRELILNGKISGASHWKKDNGGSTGTLVLGNANNDFTGVLTNFSGTLIVSANGALGSVASGTVINNAASLAFRGGVNYSVLEPVSVTGMGRLGFGVLSNESGGNSSFSGPVTMTGNSGVGGAPATTLTLNGPIGEAGGSWTLSKLTAGTVKLTAANSYSGGTLISNGVLVVANSSGSATGPGPITIFPGATLAGPGTVAGPVTVGGLIGPGSSPGTMISGAQTWTSGGSYAFEINDATGTAGADPGWDLLNINGALTISATPAGKFTIGVSTLTLANVAGSMANFVSALDYNWRIATASSGITGFDPAAINLDTTAVANTLGSGSFVVDVSGNDLRLRFGHAPTIACPGTFTQNTDPGVCTSRVTWNTPANGPGPITVQCKVTAGALPVNTPVSSPFAFPKGTTTVTCTASNPFGSNSCSFNVTVNDNQPPSVTCPANVGVQCIGDVPAPNIAGVTATDVCGGSPTVTYVGDVTNAAPCLTTVIRTYRATDASMNSATCTQIITVADTMPPVITCPSNITVQCLSNVPASDLTLVTATDNCGGGVTKSWMGDVYTISGCVITVARTYKAVDSCSNVMTCVQTITVRDTTPPVVTCGANQTFQCGAAWSFATATISDNCDPRPALSILSTATNATCGSAYTATRTWRGIDVCNNSTLCTQVVSVVDTTAPVITRCATNRTVTAPLTLRAPVPDMRGEILATDCSGTTFVDQRPAPGTTVPVGVTNVTLLVRDTCNNTNTCIAVLTVLRPNFPPVAIDKGGSTPVNVPFTIAIAKLMGGAIDPEGDPITFTGVSATSRLGGTVVQGATSVTYTPPTDYTGVDRFTFTIADNRGNTDTGNVDVLVATGTLPSQNQMSLAVLPGGVQVRFAGIAGFTYLVQRATSVMGPWATLSTQVAPLHGIIEYLDTMPPAGSAFYRTVKP